MTELDEPFRVRLRQPWIPVEMTTAPELGQLPAAGSTGPQPETRYALLINPFYAKDAHASFGKHVLTPTLALTSFAAASPPHWRVAYWDENLLDGRPPFDPMPQVVGITVHLTFAQRAFELADWYRACGAKVILGGLHVLSCPDECAPHADALALGDGVQLWPRILRDIEVGTLQPRYTATYENDYASDPPPRRSILPRHSFLATTSLIATRGCHNRCGFCYLATDGLRMPYRMKHPRQIVEEFAADHQPYAVFIDNNLGSRRDYLHQLCAALRPLDKIWSAAVTIDVTDDNLAAANKKTPKTFDYARRVSLLHDYGIQVNGSFVLGFDHDQKDVFVRTAEWIEENRLECATFHILTPYPATPLFRQMESEGRLLHRDWTLDDTGHAVFRPRHMTPQELEQGYAWICQRLFSHSSIWRRRPRQWEAVPVYLAVAYLYKRSNRFWRLLIKHDLVNPVWKPLVKITRLRQVRYRRRLAQKKVLEHAPGEVVSAGV
jgi:Domain of unknown function (DUF4070)